MTKEELAALLNGREYGQEITQAEEAAAKDARLVVVFGYSDDNVELRGAISDEVGMYDGGQVVITTEGVMPEWENLDGDIDSAREFFRKELLPRADIDCEWSPSDEPMSWRYSTDKPHSTFLIMEDGEIYCRGLVIALGDLSS